MSPSAGEKISSKNVTIKQADFPTREPGERQFKVLGNTVTIKQPNEGGASYVTVQLEPLNLEEGTPKGRAFPMFFLDGEPNAQTGVASYESANGCMAFARACGDEFEPTWIEQEVVYTGNKAKKKGKDGETLVIINPEELKQYIMAHDGQVVTAYEGLKKVSEKEKLEFPNHKDQNTIDRWIIPEALEGNGLPARRK